jgi:hypothetical protein
VTTKPKQLSAELSAAMFSSDMWQAYRFLEANGREIIALIEEQDGLGAAFVKRGERIAVLEAMLRQLIERASKMDRTLFGEFPTGEAYEEDQVIKVARLILEKP